MKIKNILLCVAKWKNLFYFHILRLMYYWNNCTNDFVSDFVSFGFSTTDIVI